MGMCSLPVPRRTLTPDSHTTHCVQAAQQYALQDGVNWELVAQIVTNSTQLPSRNRSARMCEERCVCVCVPA